MAGSTPWGWGGNWYKGMVDDFRVYSVELNSAEINEIYNDDLPVALLPFVSSDNQNRRIQTLTINFKRSGLNANATGLALDDFTVTGGTLSNLTGSGSTYNVTLTAKQHAEHRDSCSAGWFGFHNGLFLCQSSIHDRILRRDPRIQW